MSIKHRLKKLEGHEKGRPQICVVVFEDDNEEAVVKERLRSEGLTIDQGDLKVIRVGFVEAINDGIPIGSII